MMAKKPDDKVVSLHGDKKKSGPAPGLNVVDGSGPYELFKENGLWFDEWTKFDDLTVPEPKAEEVVVGRLSPYEEVIFAAMVAAREEFDDLQREAASTTLHKGADAIKQKKEDDFDVSGTVSDELGASLCEARQRFNHLQNDLYWRIGHGIGDHRFKLGVRAGGRIVKGERHY